MESVKQSIREFQSELDQRNAQALQELNRQIDELANIPIDDLPPFVDSIELTSPPKSFQEISPTDRNENLTFQLDNDLKEFQKLSKNESLHLDSRLESLLDSKQEQLGTSYMLDQLDKDIGHRDSPGVVTPYLSKETIDLLSKYEKQTLPLQNPILTQISAFAPSHVTDSPLFKTELDNHRVSQSNSAPKVPEPNSSVLYSSMYEKAPLSYTESYLPNSSKPYNETPFQDHVDHLSARLDSLQTKHRFEPTVCTEPVPAQPIAQDSREIIDIIRTLQDRLGKLEGEKEAAKTKIEGLEKELSTTRHMLFQQQHEKSQPVKDTLPPLDGSLRTLESITQAKIGVSNLKERVDRTLQLSDSSSQLVYQEIDKNLNSSTNALKEVQDRLTQERSSNSVSERPPVQERYSQSQRTLMDRYTSPMPPSFQKSEIKTAWDSEIGPMESFSKTNSVKEAVSPVSPFKPAKEPEFKRPKSPFTTSTDHKSFLAQEEILKLKKEIEQERQARAYPVAVPVKEKVGQKTKSEPVLKKKLTERKDPVWKKTEKKRSTFRESTAAHIRKKGPIEVPTVVGAADDTGKREMPFIVGTNTGKSFSVTANLQKVFSLLKSHNPELCSVCSKRQQPCSRHRDAYLEPKPVHVLDTPEPSRGRVRTRTEPSVEAPVVAEQEKDTNENLYQMLGILEQEFRQFKEQYHSLVKQYEIVAESMTNDAITQDSGSATLKAIGDDLTHCIQSMETKVLLINKSEQIKILKEITASSVSLVHRKPVERKKKQTPQKHYTMDTVTSRLKKEKEESAKWESMRRRARSQSPGRAMASLSLLKSTLKVQNALGE